MTRLHEEIVRAPALPDVRERLAGAGVEILATTPEEFTRIMRADAIKFDRIIKQAGIKLD